MKTTEDVRKYAVEQAIAEEEALEEALTGKVEGFSPLGGEREDVSAAKGRMPRIREQTSRFVEKGAAVYVKA